MPAELPRNPRTTRARSHISQNIEEIHLLQIFTGSSLQMKVAQATACLLALSLPPTPTAADFPLPPLSCCRCCPCHCFLIVALLLANIFHSKRKRNNVALTTRQCYTTTYNAAMSFSWLKTSQMATGACEHRGASAACLRGS